MPDSIFGDAVQAILEGSTSVQDAAERIFAEFTEDEKLSLLDGGDTPMEFIRKTLRNGYCGIPQPALQVPRLGLPGIHFSDGPRGILSGTAFPTPSARANSWNPELEEDVGRAMGAELNALGGNYFGGVCVNLAPNPKWGRAQESYGEDPLLVGSMGAALSRGAGERTIACVKHFAVNTMENARFKVDVQVDDDVLHEVYLPHFRQCLDEGKAESVMSAYNLINGEYCGESAALLNGVLRDIWGYDDVVVTSDWLFGLRNAGRSVQAGLDVEMPLKSIRAAHLGQELRDGLVTWASIDRIVRRQIRFQLKYHVRTFGSTKLDPRKVVRCSEHRDLARKVATQGMVLLKNDDRLLPLSKEKTKQLLVIGSLATSEQTGDRGSSRVRDPDVVTPLHGLEQQKDVEIVYVNGSDLEEVEDAIQHADAVFLLVGYTAEDEGEYLVSAEPAILQAVLPGVFPYVFVATIFVATLRLIGAATAFLSGVKARMPGGDRRSLSLNESDAHLAKAVTLLARNKLVIGVEASGPVILPTFVRDNARSILFTGYGGCQFGNALRDVLFGDAEPSGRLAYGIVESESDLPDVDWNATAVRYTRWWGYRLSQQRQTAAAYPFGYGLGYGRFTFDGAQVRAPSEIDTRFFEIEVQVENQGPLPSSTVVQVYLGKAEDRKANDYERALVGFRRVEELPAGGSALVNLQCRLDPVAHWSSGNGGFSVDAGRYNLFVSRHEGDAESACREVTVSNVTWSTKTSVQ